MQLFNPRDCHFLRTAPRAPTHLDAVQDDARQAARVIAMISLRVFIVCPQSVHVIGASPFPSRDHNRGIAGPKRHHDADLPGRYSVTPRSSFELSGLHGSAAQHVHAVNRCEFVIRHLLQRMFGKADVPRSGIVRMTRLLSAGWSGSPSIGM